jgi:hypothetical protein
MAMQIHEDARPGNGLYDEICDALDAIVMRAIPAMFKAQEPWALMGSMASVLQGINDYRPPDLDIVTSEEGAYIMEGAVSDCGVTLRPVAKSTGGPYTSYFGIFEVNGIKAEIMGELEIRVADARLIAAVHWSRWSERVRVLHFRGKHIPVVPLEWQLVANAMLERPERVSGISAYLLAHGWDQGYLELLLGDQNYGPRTMRTVREALKLA